MKKENELAYLTKNSIGFNRQTNHKQFTEKINLNQFLTISYSLHFLIFSQDIQ